MQDIRIAETVTEIILTKKAGELQEEERMEIIRFTNQFKYDYKQNPRVTLQDIRNHILTLPKGSKERKQANQRLQTIIKIKDQIDKLKSHIDKGQDKPA